MSPLYAVILFRFFSFTFLIHQYMLSFFKFCLFTSAFLFRHCISPFYFATVFRLFISPIFFPLLFHFTIYFCPSNLFRHSFFALLFYFAILFALCCISPSFFALLIYFAILFAFYHILPFFLLFYFISPFFSPFYFVFSFIFSNANSFPHFYIRSTFKYILAHGDEYTTTTLHTFHDSWESESQQHIILFTTHTTHNDSRLTKLGIQYCMRLIRLTKPEIQYDSRLTTLVFSFARQFCLAFFAFLFRFISQLSNIYSFPPFYIICIQILFHIQTVLLFTFLIFVTSLCCHYISPF